ncbi:MAG: tyrosine-type recombinase/integrase [Candidatus Bathyarchaeia archaeon]
MVEAASPLLRCPECGSERLYRDGLRYLSSGEAVQRWLCRSCGYRFSEKRFSENSFKECQTEYANRQVCAILEEAKNLSNAQETRTCAGERETQQQEAKGIIVEYGFYLLKQGYAEATIQGRVKLLRRLVALGADLADEESVKEVIAKAKWAVSRKVNAVETYTSLLKMQGKTWNPPLYKRERKLPFIPTEIELDQLIAGCSRTIATYLQLLKETGARCGEISALKWTDIDLEQRLVRITPEKHSNPRILPISTKLVEMLRKLPMDKERIFSGTNLMRRNYNRQRRRIVAKLGNPRLMQISFHTFRHWKATMEYAKTKDILHVKEVLGHKSINNTLLYTQLVNFKDDEYTSAIAHSIEEACKLVEAGFEYVCDFGAYKLFRKRK